MKNMSIHSIKIMLYGRDQDKEFELRYVRPLVFSIGEVGGEVLNVDTKFGLDLYKMQLQLHRTLGRSLDEREIKELFECVEVLLCNVAHDCSKRGGGLSGCARTLILLGRVMK